MYKCNSPCVVQLNNENLSGQNPCKSTLFLLACRDVPLPPLWMLCLETGRAVSGWGKKTRAFLVFGLLWWFMHRVIYWSFREQNYISQVIRLILRRPNAPIRSGDRFSYQALPFMEHLQLLQKAKGFTRNGLFFFFFFFWCAAKQRDRKQQFLPHGAPVAGRGRRHHTAAEPVGLAPALHGPSPHKHQCLH